MISTNKLFEYLSNIPDPEIPVINIVEMGIVRDIESIGDELVVKITPTYSGCPAMKSIEQEIIAELKLKGFDKVLVKNTYTPAWSTDLLTDEAKRKLKEYGIAPPEGKAEDEFYRDLITKPIECPYCNSRETKLTSQFGSTACKSLHYCNSCQQPFEHFKCI
ncbi:MAG: 1,2-phenylacetyl-CoA epoxidase subunit PaaD [Melioribacteraceae bacterium]|nr:MAG: 1,2-phenylacetyl-CoA epoxidase subunit PaaD [Melioribacteraceae bacterium]